MEDALADLVKAFWPNDTRPSIEREWGLNANEARRVMEGRASKATITRVLRHPAGEYAVGLYLLSRVIGRDIESYLAEQDRLEDIEREAREAEANARRARMGRVSERLSSVGMLAAE